MELPWIVLFLWIGPTVGQGQQKQHRPLWILEDGLTKRQRQDRPEADYETTTRMTPLMIRRQGRGPAEQPGAITFLVRHEDREAAPPPPPPPPPPQRRFMMPHHRLQLPHQYVQHPGIQKSRSHRREGRRHLPVFDNGPGENSLQLGSSSRDNYPIFVYNGTRGELILNTMLSRRRYPMQEPVPGQVLYPPSTPMFRPKPIVERFRMPGQREMMNLTLIPFYAHEAIGDPAAATQEASTTTTTPPPPPYERKEVTQLGKRKRKKAKQYEAFHSPQEVMQWQTVLRRSTGHNHRNFPSEEMEMEVEEEEEENQDDLDWPTEPETVETLEEPTETSTSSSSASSPSEPFQIVYIDESLERPVVESLSTTTAPPTLRQSSRYALKKEYYAFPVYTLGKLLQPQGQTSMKLREKSDRSARSSGEREPSTWFILNSRYKGPHHRSLAMDNQTKYYTSKYIENGFRPRR
ncbi:uncharacterized protein [Drosophila takahashii]|uniref:uncharacterized protein n=1 Tax=Drosophila takahashii TaxID=29030 RepID=UPI001CF8B99C|nr:uncharacterized protein LOC108055796 [Drosophila takahashii]